jgi:hypothetical protein
MKQGRSSPSIVRRLQIGEPHLAKEGTSRWWYSGQGLDIYEDALSNRLQLGLLTKEHGHYSRITAKIAAKDPLLPISLLAFLIPLLSLRHHLENKDLAPLLNL